MRPDCERYFEDPDGNPEHLAACPDCQAVFGVPAIESRNVKLGQLPLAPWEGANFRSWPLVLGGALTLISMAAALFAMTGVGPARGVRQALSSTVPSLDLMMNALQMFGSAVREAPRGWQIAIILSFFAVNAALVALLRRAPRGIDV
jgi:hypothetical protein